MKVEHIRLNFCGNPANNVVKYRYFAYLVEDLVAHIWVKIDGYVLYFTCLECVNRLQNAFSHVTYGVLRSCSK